MRGLVVDLIGEPTYDYTSALLAAVGTDSPPRSPVLLGRDLKKTAAAAAG